MDPRIGALLFLCLLIGNQTHYNRNFPISTLITDLATIALILAGATSMIVKLMAGSL